ncbi:MAG: SsrA-binding protein SmpB [Candidatus Levybacteria bacterium]|nr:SsrA-binding protein SmpB [Candidatus Levybacteria bacterium]
MKIVNKRATFDYTLLDSFEAGINLFGQEVKAIRLGHADLTSSYARIIGGEVHLINAKVFPYEFARTEDYNQSRTRKLLLHKKQILSLKSKMDASNLTIVPVSIYTTHNLIKVELALAKPKKQFDKKAKIKKRDLDRDLDRAVKAYS